MSTAAAREGTLLLCIDMQPVFVRTVPDGAAVLRRCRFAVCAARGLGMAVAFTEQVPQKLGGTDSELLSLAGAAGVHAKAQFSALHPDGPLAALAAAGSPVCHLVLCGVETPICVYQTATDALSSGLAVTVLSDCVGARREADARVCLDALARAGARVIPSETFFYSALGAATHPFFRGFTELVKTYG